LSSEALSERLCSNEFQRHATATGCMMGVVQRRHGSCAKIVHVDQIDDDVRGRALALRDQL
jgi:hypothetical protein